MQLPKQGEPAHGIKIQTLGDCFSEAPGGGGGVLPFQQFCGVFIPA